MPSTLMNDDVATLNTLTLTLFFNVKGLLFLGLMIFVLIVEMSVFHTLSVT